MLEARKERKTAFMIMDQLIIYDGPPDPDKKLNGRSRTELSENDNDDDEVHSPHEMISTVFDFPY